MAVVAVIAPAHMSQHAQLPRRQRAIWDCDPQHVGMKLQVDAVHEPQRLELFLGQSTRYAAADLVAELSDPFGHNGAVEFVVQIHVKSQM